MHHLVNTIYTMQVYIMQSQRLFYKRHNFYVCKNYRGTKLQHSCILKGFKHYFGTYPGADGLPEDVCIDGSAPTSTATPRAAAAANASTRRSRATSAV